jgi:hypothetical protein
MRALHQRVAAKSMEIGDFMEDDEYRIYRKLDDGAFA